jgi:hypothetical protein
VATTGRRTNKEADAQPNEIAEILNRSPSQELLARDVTRLGYVATGATSCWPPATTLPPVRPAARIQYGCTIRAVALDLRWTRWGCTTRSSPAGRGLAAEHPDLLVIGKGAVDDTVLVGGQRLDYTASSAGDHVDIPFAVERSGDYQVGLRYLRAASDAAVQVSIDGQPAGPRSTRR